HAVGYPTHPPPHVRHAPAGPGRRSAPDPGPARPQSVVDHPALYSRRLCPAHEGLRSRAPASTTGFEMMNWGYDSHDVPRARHPRFKPGSHNPATTVRATTVLCVRHRDQVAMTGDQSKGASTAPSEPPPGQDCAGKAGARTAP